MLNSDMSCVFFLRKCWKTLLPWTGRSSRGFNPIRYSIRCDKFGNQRWHRTNRDQEAPCRRTSRNWRKLLLFAYSDSRKGDFLMGLPLFGVWTEELTVLVVSPTESTYNMIKYIMTCLEILSIPLLFLVSLCLTMSSHWSCIQLRLWHEPLLHMHGTVLVEHRKKNTNNIILDFLRERLAAQNSTGLRGEICHPCFGSFNFFSSWVWIYLRGYSPIFQMFHSMHPVCHICSMVRIGRIGFPGLPQQENGRISSKSAARAWEGLACKERWQFLSKLLRFHLRKTY